MHPHSIIQHAHLSCSSPHRLRCVSSRFKLTYPFWMLLLLLPILNGFTCGCLNSNPTTSKKTGTSHVDNSDPSTANLDQNLFKPFTSEDMDLLLSLDSDVAIPALEDAIKDNRGHEIELAWLKTTNVDVRRAAIKYLMQREDDLSEYYCNILKELSESRLDRMEEISETARERRASRDERGRDARPGEKNTTLER